MLIELIKLTTAFQSLKKIFYRPKTAKNGQNFRKNFQKFLSQKWSFFGHFLKSFFKIFGVTFVQFFCNATHFVDLCLAFNIWCKPYLHDTCIILRSGQTSEILKIRGGKSTFESFGQNFWGNNFSNWRLPHQFLHDFDGILILWFKFARRLLGLEIRGGGFFLGQAVPFHILLSFIKY